MANKSTKRKKSNSARTVGAEFETEQKAITLMRTQLPAAWIIRPQDPDFHIDYLVEVSKNGELSGIQTGVQLKGTAPKKPFRKGPQYQVKGKHIRYYLEKCTFPLFLFLADVSHNVIYWIFLQEYAKTKMTPIQIGQKKITVTFDLSRTISNLADFEKATVAAERYMRELRPGSIQAAVKSRKDELEAKDSRIKVEVNTVGGAEHISLRAVEAISFKTQFKPKDAAAFGPAFKDFVESGKPIDIEVNDLAVTGSPLFAELMERDGSAKIAIGPAKKIIADALIQIPGKQIPPLFVAGTVTAGTKNIRFEAPLANSPLVVRLEIPISSGPGNASISFDFIDNGWAGQPIVSLPYFEQIRGLFSALDKNEAVQFELFRAGNRVLGAEVKDINSKGIADTISTLAIFHGIRSIMRHFKSDAAMPNINDITQNDLATVEELSGLLETRRFESSAQNCEVKFTLDGKTAPDQFSNDVTLTFPFREFELFGQKLRLGPIRHRFTSMRVEHQAQVANGVEFKLKGDDKTRQTLEWIEEGPGPAISPIAKNPSGDTACS